MKTRDLILFVLVAIAINACSENMMLTEPIENTVLSRSNEQTAISDDYTVTPEMVCKYINLTHKGRTINSLNPIIQNGDTLAYVAQYADSLGWELISGDKRLEPVLAFSNNGSLELSNTENPSINAIEGILTMTKAIKESSDTLKHQVWNALEPKQMNTIMPLYDGVLGMWVSVDTINESSQQRINHIIKTKWGQEAPWFDYTPWIEVKEKTSEGEYKFQLSHCLVGCPAVAVGQLIYHFRKNDNKNILIPTSVNFTDTIEGATPIFSNYSIPSWNNMAEKSTETGTENVAKFLSFVGNQLNTNYGLSSGIHKDSASIAFNRVLDYYKLGRATLNNYNFNKLVESLTNDSPVLICAFSQEGLGHVFLIDQYIKNIDRTYVNYMWDPDYKVTENDLRYAEPWRFQEPVSGDYKKEVDLYVNSGSKISMNWGYDGIGDNTFYAASAYLLVGEYDDIYTEVPYSPYWAYDYKDENDNSNIIHYNNVTYMIYNLHDIND